MQNVELDECVECAICHELLVCPVTMICQHTFCRLCIQSYIKQQIKPSLDEEGFEVYVPPKDRIPKCPMCRCAIIMPINDNFVLKALLEKAYPQEYKDRLDNFHDKGLMKLNLKDQVEEEIRNELYNVVIENRLANTNEHEYRNASRDEREGIVYSRPLWIKRIFPNKIVLTLVFTSILMFIYSIFVKLGISSKMFIGTSMILWGIFCFILYKYPQI